jgi:DNA polymerase-3 subunit alpha
MSFVHLHCHDGEGSLLDSTIFVKELPKRAKELGMNAIATTNHGYLLSSIDFYNECLKNEIKPIMGCEFYVCDDIGKKEDRKSFHLIALAKNNIGWENIKKLCTKGILDGFYYKPRIDINLLREHSDGVIITTACLGGELPKMITNDYDEQMMIDYINEYKDIFGADFYLEIQAADNEDQARVNKKLCELADKTNVELVATSDIHFLFKEDYELHGTFIQINQGRDNEVYKDCWMKDSDEMLEVLYKQVDNRVAETAIHNTQKIADMCNVTLKLGESYLPSVLRPDEFETDIDYMRYLLSKGFKDKGYNEYPNSQEYIDRINYEMDIIVKKDFVGYFLILADIIGDCKKKDFPIAPARGSAGGSLVADLLDITDIDPIKYGLDFGRFLTLERMSPPDIDTDFASSKRYDVIHMVRERYGEQNVAQIMTFGKMQSKAIIDAVGKVMGYSVAERAEIKKNVVPNKRIADTLINDKDLVSKHRELINYCARLEGLPRSTSLHAGGLVICPDGHDMTEFAPLILSKEKELAVQCTKKTVEKVGLVKYDFLATVILDIINDCIVDVGSSFYDFKWDYEDKDVWDYICTGETAGMFQTESEFMTNILMKIQPKSIEDLCAVISLGRPDTMGEVDPYVRVKSGEQDPYYYDDLLKPVLESTYGMMIYQETFMNIAKVYAGYSDGEADDLRKGLGLKDKELVKIEANKFYDRAVGLGRPESTCRELADILMEKGGYCFNKSHGIAYAIISYWTAYLKYYYPLEFMASTLNNQKKESGQIDYDGVSKYISACKEMGVNILPPSVNTTTNIFTPNHDNHSITFGFDLLKGVSKKCVNAIVKHRTYADYEDYIARTGLSLNKTDTIALIKSGALDCLTDKGKTYMFKYFYNERYLLSAEEIKPYKKINKNHIQYILDNGLASPDEVEDKELCLERINYHRKVLGWVDFKDKYLTGSELNWEMETLNTFLSGDPFEGVILPDWEGIDIETSGTLGGVIQSIKNVTTKKGKNPGQKMAFLNVNTRYGVIDVVVFPSQWEKYSDILTLGNTITIYGEKTDEYKCTLQTAQTLEQYIIKTNYLYRNKKAV